MQYRLLAVEDNKAIADIINNTGCLAGFETRMANTDQEFIAAYETFQPDVIVLDIVMPGMDGFEVLKFLKDRNSQSHIVILSGEPDFRRMAGNIGHIYGLSIEASIQKPFRVHALRQILEEVRNHISVKICAVTPNQRRE